MNDIDTLSVISEKASVLKARKSARETAVKVRDAAAWHLHVNNGWTHTAILGIFGTASHDAWTKSRKRMEKAHPDGVIPPVDDAETVLKGAVNVIKASDKDITHADRAYLHAVLAAAEAGATQSAMATAAGVSRQAIHMMLKRQGIAA